MFRLISVYERQYKVEVFNCIVIDMKGQWSAAISSFLLVATFWLPVPEAQPNSNWSPASSKSLTAMVSGIIGRKETSQEEKLRALDNLRIGYTNRHQKYYDELFGALEGKKSTAVQSIQKSPLHSWYDNNQVTLMPKRNGVAGVSSIINDARKIIMCTVPKIDSSTWRKVMLYLEHPEFYLNNKYITKDLGNKKFPDQHNVYIYALNAIDNSLGSAVVYLD